VRRLGRAEEHLESIKQELLGYYNCDPCTLSGKYKPDADGIAGGGERSAKLDPLGVRLNTLIGEFLHDLRCPNRAGASFWRAPVLERSA
jgi:hypothetical protein